MGGFVGTRGQWVTVAEYLGRSVQGRGSVLAWDGEFLRVRGDLREGGAGHHVREGAEMAMILPSPLLSHCCLPNRLARFAPYEYCPCHCNGRGNRSFGLNSRAVNDEWVCEFGEINKTEQRWLLLWCLLKDEKTIPSELKCTVLEHVPAGASNGRTQSVLIVVDLVVLDLRAINEAKTVT